MRRHISALGNLSGNQILSDSNAKLEAVSIDLHKQKNCRCGVASFNQRIVFRNFRAGVATHLLVKLVKREVEHQ